LLSQYTITEFEYREYGGQPEIVVDFDKVVSYLENKGVRDHMEVLTEITYPVA